MKVLLMTVAVIAFLGNALADGWVVSNGPSDERVTVPTDGSSPSMENQRKLAGRESVLPPELPIGSPEKVRDFIVSTNSGHGLLNVFVRLGFQNQSAIWTEIGVVKATYGYESYEKAMEDIALGAQEAIKMALNSDQRPNEHGVYAVLRVFYWCDRTEPLSVPTDTGLWITTLLASSLEEVTLQETLRAFQPGSTASVEQVIIPIFSLNHIDAWVRVGTEIRAMTWSDRDGMSLSSWPSKPKQWATTGYLFINGWMAVGQYPARLTLGVDGEERTYTQFGEELQAPILRIVDSRTIEVQSTKGSDLEVLFSTNNISWKSFQVVTNATPLIRATLTNAPPTAFFRAIAR